MGPKLLRVEGEAGNISGDDTLSDIHTETRVASE